LTSDKYVLIRGFYKDPAEKADVEDRIRIVKDLFSNPQQISQATQASVLDDIADSISQITLDLHLGGSSTKSLSPMVLPNGIDASPIPKQQMISQVVDLTRGSEESEIECLNPQISYALMMDDSNISNKKYNSIFPRGGPKQRTWLDIREDLAKVSHIIEIGIITIPNGIK
jgi:hypothetical protein